MIQSGEYLRFSPEPSESIRIERERIRQHLERHVTIQLRVTRPVDLAHATSANQRDNLVWAEASAGSESHGKWLGL
jgi:hypothetical protein